MAPKILIPTTDPSDWRRLLAKPETQWRDGYSAKAAAERWEACSGWPPEIAQQFDLAGWGPTELLIAMPEWKTPLPGGTRESLTDVLALVRTKIGVVACGIEAKVVEYVLGFPWNSSLDQRIRRLLGRVRMMSKESGETATLFGETRYAARSWKRKRRIVMKAEVVRYPGREARDNPRYLVTNLKDAPVDVYNVYRQRVDVENRIKELHHGIEMDRTSCIRFLPNQLRVLMTAASFVLLQEMRRLLAGTDCARSQVTTIRERLLKMAAHVTRSARRIVLHLPTSSAWFHAWKHLAMQVGAVGG